jgi:hypothetical protein
VNNKKIKEKNLSKKRTNKKPSQNTCNNKKRRTLYVFEPASLQDFRINQAKFINKKKIIKINNKNLKNSLLILLKTNKLIK